MDAGVELPQMLKCQWAGRTPTVTQIPFPEGDYFSTRVQESVRLAQHQISRQEKKAALLELFGDDFDIGEQAGTEISLMGPGDYCLRMLLSKCSLVLLEQRVCGCMLTLKHADPPCCLCHQANSPKDLRQVTSRG